MSATMAEETDKRKLDESKLAAEPKSAPSRSIGPQYSSLVEYPKESSITAADSRSESGSADSQDPQEKNDESGDEGIDGEAGAVASESKKDSDKDDVISR